MARCNLAIWPFITTKREPVNFTAEAKSKPCKFSPNATWSFTSKSNLRGSPQRDTSRFSVSSFPKGTSSAGIFGMFKAMSFNAFCTFSNSTLPCSNSAPMWSTSANNGAISSPRAFAAPIALERALRSACNVSVFTCKALRCSSSCVIFATSSVKPRLIFNFSATSARLLRSKFGSIILLPFFFCLLILR